MGTLSSKETPPAPPAPLPAVPPADTVPPANQPNSHSSHRLLRPLSFLLNRAATSSQDTNDEPAHHHPLWVLIKAKTRIHNSNRMIRKSVWFEAKPNTGMNIGRSDQCELVLDDDRCANVNARVSTLLDHHVISLSAEARMYRLIGMGMKPKSLLVPLSVGMVIKVGSVSLEVTQLCTKEGDNFLQRFESELVSSAATFPVLPRAGSKESMITDQSDDDANNEEFVPPVDEEPAPAICYICWGGPEDPIGEEDLNKIKGKGQTKSLHQQHAALKHDPNPLIRNPCGKCSGSSRYVHLQCILTWIKSSGSGHCSICNGALPQHFSSPPPNLELKVVRHRRGHSWVGNRRFRLSFVDKQTAVIGRDAGAEVRLSDRSVCGEHAKVIWDRDAKQFFIQDASSVSGTYVQLIGQLALPINGEATYVKIGRSTLSFRVMNSKRNSFSFGGMLPVALRG